MEKEKEGNNRGAKEREKLYRHNRFSSEGIRRFRYIYIHIQEWQGNERERLGQWIEEKIRESRYKKQNDVSGRPGYLRREIKVGDKGGENLTVRQRCGNEKERNRFWKTEEGRKYVSDM